MSVERDIAGLYLKQPQKTRARVLGVEEKSQVQALDRSQPILPLRPGQVGRCTHDYLRHGTSSLFAALDIATGKVIGRCHSQHRRQQFLRFLQQIDDTVPADLEIHLPLDNHGTHQAPKVAAWFKRRPRYHLHFTPTSGSWLNPVERRFAKITEQRLCRSAFHSVAELEKAIRHYLETNNARPTPFVWTASPISASARPRLFAHGLEAVMNLGDRSKKSVRLHRTVIETWDGIQTNRLSE